MNIFLTAFGMLPLCNLAPLPQSSYPQNFKKREKINGAKFSKEERN
jgi:hypothetical protein